MKRLFQILLILIVSIYTSHGQDINNLCSKPLYAPESNTHLNCYKMYWPETVPFGLKWTYALTGGQKERRKDGFWQEYSPQQILVCEGRYKRGKKRGMFKYYRPDGIIQREETDRDRRKQINLYKPGV